ncbi:MAG: tRNA 2-thiouridine(34) synthase MnmA [Desulfovibrio sp.]|nr:tRNA 2-thiouridine(34) synthase MnmA [Desulfovibrio sp.]
MRIAVAVSGGVDSLCALLLLQRAGHEVMALHALLAEPSPASASPLPGLEAACRTLGVPLRVVDLRARFAREVVTPFAAAYAEGRTPNPCALCNRHIKFGALLDVSLELGAERLATGHYARIVGGTRAGAPGPLLARATHAPKDQSYFLSLVPRERLGRVLFPLADMDKAACAALVAEGGLAVPVPQESHDICFAPGGVDAYREFLEQKWQALGITPPGPGPVLLREEAAGLEEGCGACPAGAPLRQIGSHAGLWRYTEGQRRGLGFAHTEALHVLHKDVAANALVVGPRRLLGMRALLAGEVNVAVDPRFWPERPLVRCRYGGGLSAASAQLEGNRLSLSFAEACFPTAAGQVATLYDEEGVVLAGAVVEEVLA